MLFNQWTHVRDPTIFSSVFAKRKRLRLGMHVRGQNQYVATTRLCSFIIYYGGIEISGGACENI